MSTQVRPKYDNMPSLKLAGILFFGLATIVICFGFALKSDSEVAAKIAWEKSLSHEEIVRTDSILKKLERMAHTSLKGRNVLYVTKKNNKPRVEMILLVTKNKEIVIREAPWQIAGKAVKLNRKFAYNITEIYYPGDKEYAELAARFLLQSR